MARAASATRKSGVRNDISAHPRQTLPRRQITEQRVIERQRGADQRVIDAVGAEPLGEAGDMRLHQLAILLAKRLGHDRNLLPAFEILERRWIREREIELGG